MHNMKNVTQDEKNVVIEIPKWALPKEEITFYIKIKKQLKFSKIIIEFPSNIELKDRINIIDSSYDGKKLIINSIGKLSMSTEDYCGVTVATNEISNDLATKSKINISIIDENKNVTYYETYVRVFRPHLKITQIPESISLGNVEETTLPIHFEFEGFGDISLRIESRINGIFVSEDDTFMDKLLQGWLNEGVLDEFKNNDENDITINKEQLVKDLDALKTKIDADPLYVKKLMDNKKYRSEAITFLKKLSDSKQEKFIDVMTDTMQGYLIKKISDMFSRNFGKHLYLSTGTNIKTQIKTEITQLAVTIHYKDLLNNEYEPLIANVKITDKRIHGKKFDVVIPIDIENVNEKKAYRNVMGMEIDHVS